MLTVLNNYHHSGVRYLARQCSPSESFHTYRKYFKISDLILTRYVQPNLIYIVIYSMLQSSMSFDKYISCIHCYIIAQNHFFLS